MTPYGYCKCGCGGKTNLAANDIPKRGVIKGEPNQYILGHHARGKSYTRLPRDFVERHEINQDTGCWEWTGWLDHHGYGRVNLNKKQVYTHRFYYEKYKETIPEGLQIDHLCRNPKCVNPDHLEAVTLAENCRRGLRPKINMEIAKEIRARYAVGDITQKKLGEEYGFSNLYISMIVTGKRWNENV